MGDDDMEAVPLEGSIGTLCQHPADPSTALQHPVPGRAAVDHLLTRSPGFLVGITWSWQVVHGQGDTG